VVTFGEGFDIPVPADYDGDGITDIAVYRRTTGQWFILNSSTNTTTTATWGGGSTDLPEPGDYDGDGKADLAVFGGVDHQRWLILKSSTGTPLTISSGSGEIAGTGQLIDYAVAMMAQAQVSEISRATDFDNDRKSDPRSSGHQMALGTDVVVRFPDAANGCLGHQHGSTCAGRLRWRRHHGCRIFQAVDRRVADQSLVLGTHRHYLSWQGSSRSG
jgi:hypothetical protein